MDGAEIAAIARLLHDALLRNRQDMFAGIKTLRGLGFDDALQSQETRIEVRDPGNALYMNDGALGPYRSLGGDKAVDETLNSLPNHASLESLISDVWREVQRPSGSMER